MQSDPIPPAQAMTAEIDERTLHRWADYIADPVTDYPNAVKKVARSYLDLAAARQSWETERTALVLAERERCCAALCWACAAGHPMRAGTKTMHEAPSIGGIGIAYEVCQAAQLRMLP
jgi:hypothetical protein